MPDDLLDKFRRQPSARPQVELVRNNSSSASVSEDDKVIEPSSQEYQAFNAVGKKRERLAFRPLNTPWERLTYRYLLRVIEDNGRGTQLVLVFTFAVVLIKGRNLRVLADAIDRERCAFVQQFDLNRWKGQPPDGETVVTQLEVITDKSPAETLAEAGL